MTQQDNQPDESKLREQADRGEEARKVLENPMFRAAFEAAEDGVINVFKGSKIGDETTHRHARETLGLLSNVRQFLEHHMRTGDAAHKKLTQLKDPNLLDRIKSVV